MTNRDQTSQDGSIEQGTLDIRIDSDSMYFKNNIPVRIRDNRMRVLNVPRQQRKFNLTPGVYQVSAVLEDGQEHKHVIRVVSGETASVEMRSESETTPVKRPVELSSRSLKTSGPPRYTKRNESSTSRGIPMSSGADEQSEAMEQARGPNRESTSRGDGAPRSNDVNSSRLIQLSGSHRLDDHENPWMLKCDDGITEVPTAIIEVASPAGPHRYTISLPTSPHDTDNYNSCVVVIEERYAKPYPAAWISPSRTVANALQNMLAANELHSAKDFADNATELLRSKYQDPTGATLGALVMHKFGILEEKQAWLENLARDFDWIPDAKILFASTLARSLDQNEETKSRAFKLAIESSKQRILYTECFSILLDLLRRWPDKLNDTERREAVANLASQAPYIDWNSICMSQHTEDDHNV